MLAMFLVWLAGVGAVMAKHLAITGLILAVCGVMSYLIRCMFWHDNGKKGPQPETKKHTWVTVVGILMFLFASMVPSEKTAYMMGGAYLGQKALESETASKVMELFNQKLDEYIAEPFKK